MFRHAWPICERVLVNLHSGDAVSGVLIAQRRSLLVLANAALISSGTDEPTAMDGQVYIERSQVAFLQAMKGG